MLSLDQAGKYTQGLSLYVPLHFLNLYITLYYIMNILGIQGTVSVEDQSLTFSKGKCSSVSKFFEGE